MEYSSVIIMRRICKVLIKQSNEDEKRLKKYNWLMQILKGTLEWLI